MRIATISAAVLTALAPQAALAEAEEGFYGSITLGGASTSDIETAIYAPDGAIFSEGYIDSLSKAVSAVPARPPSGSDIIEGSFDLKPVFAISGAIGYDFGMIRAEAELAYNRATIRSLNVTRLTGYGGTTTTNLSDGLSDVCAYLELTDCSASGNTLSMEGRKLRQISGMANLWLDIPVGEVVEPYVGGGLGIMDLEMDGDSKSVFAWQLGGGVAFHVTQKLAVTADVRYRATGAFEYDYGGGAGSNFGSVETTTYGLGLRYTF